MSFGYAAPSCPHRGSHAPRRAVTPGRTGVAPKRRRNLISAARGPGFFLFSRVRAAPCGRGHTARAGQQASAAAAPQSSSQEGRGERGRGVRLPGSDSQEGLHPPPRWSAWRAPSASCPSPSARLRSTWARRPPRTTHTSGRCTCAARVARTSTSATSSLRSCLGCTRVSSSHSGVRAPRGSARAWAILRRGT